MVNPIIQPRHKPVKKKIRARPHLGVIYIIKWGQYSAVHYPIILKVERSTPLRETKQIVVWVTASEREEIKRAAASHKHQDGRSMSVSSYIRMLVRKDQEQ